MKTKHFYSLFIILLISLTTFAQYTLDQSFNPIDIGFGAGEGLYCTNTDTKALIQSDGKSIIFGNFIFYNGQHRNNITRVNTDGTIDLSFNIGDGANGQIFSCALQNDGKIIISGIFSEYNGYAAPGIARLNTDGSFDNTFLVGTGVLGGYIFSIVIQEDGRILLAGSFGSYNGTDARYIVRIFDDGSIDDTFDSGTGPDATIRSMCLQEDGNILICGFFSTYNEINRNKIARLNSDGSIDNSFHPGAGANGLIWEAKIQDDGKILIAGNFTSYGGTTRNYIARINSDGSLDVYFNNPGVGTDEIVRSVAIQDDNKIILVGDFSDYNGNSSNYIVRLNEDGIYDDTFSIGTGADDKTSHVSLQNDGKVLVCGQFESFNNYSLRGLLRLNSDGKIDSTYNTRTGCFTNQLLIQDDDKIIIETKEYNDTIINGLVRLTNDGSIDFSFDVGLGLTPGQNIYDAFIQNDQKIVICGNITSYDGTTIYGIARLNPDGSIDNTFNPGTGPNAHIRCCDIQPDGKILIGGDFTSFNGTSISRIARLNTDGSLDNYFLPGYGPNNTVRDIKIMESGKILICGNFTSYETISRNYFARINSTGSLDYTFDVGTGADSYLSYIHVNETNNKIVVCGNFDSYNGSYSPGVARINYDGSFDDSFNVGDGASNVSQIREIGDKYFINGYITSFDNIETGHIACINSDGSLNTEIIPQISTDKYTNYLEFLSDSSIIIGGEFTNYCGVGRNGIAKLKLCPSTTNTIDISTCDYYELNDETYFESGVYTQTLLNHAGCDSIITLNLSINNNVGDTTATECGYFTWYGETFIESGTHTHTFENTAGCDSVVTLNLIINNSTSNSITETACFSYTAPDGVIYTTSGIKTAIIPNSHNCDSTITIDLTINTVDTSLIVNNTLISANTSEAIYQWLDCNNSYSQILSEDSQSFTATANGSYAVEITENGCTDTTSCIAITGVEIQLNDLKNDFLVYPNPTNNIINIVFTEIQSKILVTVYDLTGKTINQIEKSNITSLEFNIEEDPGIYFIEINTQSENKIYKIIKE